MQTLKAVIIDDERYACERLKKLLIPYPRIQVTDCITDSRSGLKYIHEEKPDLVFPDIEMGKGASAFDLVNDLRPDEKTLHNYRNMTSSLISNIVNESLIP